jgi:4-diphosphocytidyl-2-C-methyl-D-erythritol kinase
VADAGAVIGIARARCRAKINLTLRICGRRSDGWHELESLVAFAGYSDDLILIPGRDLSLSVRGPRAAIVEAGDENLVLRAARQLHARSANLHWGAFQLLKNLPVAAGIGGGSADAGAALRLLAQVNGLPLDHPHVIGAAQAVGADVPICLFSRARIMSGRGDQLGPVLSLPPLIALLVNPGMALATATVFAQMAMRPGAGLHVGPNRSPAAMQAFVGEREGFLSYLRKSGNDMEDAACVLLPVIGDILAVLSAARGCGLARMSGSGPTCFGLFVDRHQAVRAAGVIRRTQPGWWVMPTVLR